MKFIFVSVCYFMYTHIDDINIIFHESDFCAWLVYAFSSPLSFCVRGRHSSPPASTPSWSMASSSPWLRWLTIPAPIESPMTLMVVLHLSRSQSTARMMVMSSGGSPTVSRTITIVTSPAWSEITHFQVINGTFMAF